MHFYNQLGTVKNVQHGTKLKFTTTLRPPPPPITSYFDKSKGERRRMMLHVVIKHLLSYLIVFYCQTQPSPSLAGLSSFIFMKLPTPRIPTTPGTSQSFFEQDISLNHFLFNHNFFGPKILN